MRITHVVAASLIVIFASPSLTSAGMVRLSVDGEVNLPSDFFELASGDTVRLIAIFDEQLRPDGASKRLVFGKGGNAADGSLRFNIGAREFSEKNDSYFDDVGNEFPALSFNRNGDLQNIEFNVEENGKSIFFSSVNFTGRDLQGDWRLLSATTTVIPVPANLALLAPGLFAVWMLRRRTRRFGAFKRKPASVCSVCTSRKHVASPEVTTISHGYTKRAHQRLFLSGPRLQSRTCP